MQVAGWINTSKDGSKKYVSLKFSEFKPKETADNVSTTGDVKVDEIPF